MLGNKQMISVFDTTIADYNLGNEIIMESVYELVNSIFPDRFLIKLPALDSIGSISINYANKSKYAFWGGTNVLTSFQEKYRQWGIDGKNFKKFSDIILIGVGWWQYQEGISRFSRKVYKQVLHKSLLHSVRDSYTEQKLKSIGIENVINTGCPTMWRLTREHCDDIPRVKSDNVLITFTDYNQNYAFDKKLVEVACSNYNKIFIWVQGPGDRLYAEKLANLISGEITILPPRLKSLDVVLSSNFGLDYIGTRLHAGIRALQFKRRAIIIGIDNRAIEIANDFGLNIVCRERIEDLNAIINNDIKTEVEIPYDNIILWKSQFE